MQRQVVLIASGTESPISAWDLQTGTHLTSYKNNASPRNGLCCLGRDYLVAAHTGKDALQFWTWHKDQVLQRSFVVERITAVVATEDGAYLAAGGASGTIYIWEVGSGRLLRSFPAHYKCITALCILDSGSVLVSGAEDTLVNVWMLSDLLDLAQDQSSPDFHRPQPLYSWSEHTLPVTALCAGQGTATAILVSASLDRSCKIHRMSDGRLLAAITLPVSLHSVIMDAGEHCLYAGGSDGTIFEVSLVGEMAGPSGAVGSTATAAGGSSSSSSIHYAQLQGHTKAVNSLALSVDGEQLVSGSDDGTAHIWDLRSRQVVQVIQSPGKQAVTKVVVMVQPQHLAAGSGEAGGSGRQGPKRPQPLAPLVKYPGMNGNLKAWEGTPVVLDGSWQTEGLALASGLCGLSSASASQAPWGNQQGDAASAASVAGPSGLLLPGQVAAGPSAGGLGSLFVPSSGGASVELHQEVDRLKAELQRAQGVAQQWKSLHGELHKYVLDKVVPGAAVDS